MGDRMAIKPDQLPIRILFEQKHSFSVPKYQRGYAWDDQAVSDFIRDIRRCLEKRVAGEPINHFFGGLVTVPDPQPNSGRSNFEVIDGQQRLASFVLLIAALVAELRGLVGELAKKAKLTANEQKVKVYLTTTIETLRNTYLNYPDSIMLEFVDVPKLVLSKADRDFFSELIDGEEPEPERASHERLLTAWQLLKTFVKNHVLLGPDLATQAKRIQLLTDQVLNIDCTVIFMWSDTRSEAYQIFQVLNDRGVQLTESDLLRARTLEMLDGGGLGSTQEKLADAWDEVLAYKPGAIDEYLRWYFSSYEGKRPSSSELADQFMKLRFGEEPSGMVTKEKAKAIVAEVEQIDDAFELFEKFGDATWPFRKDRKTVRWERERLAMLVTHLKHSNAMPLLLALHELGSEKFADAVASLERFVFRYKTIGNAHVSPMTDLYLRHAKKIRDNPAAYRLSSLRADLRALVDKMVPLDVFEVSLGQLRYAKRGGNWHIRYFLITLEDYRAWYDKGANGIPKCQDKTTVFDFDNTTLEHVYPRSAKQQDTNAQLEPLKDSLGNLTIFGPDDNDALANKGFGEKQPALVASKLKMNQEIGALPSWTKRRIQNRADNLVKMALKIFVP